MAQQYFPGTASLIEEVDKKLMVLLRDGRTLIGYLRSFDQFANLVLHRTIERIHVGLKYGDLERGVYLVRGENVVLLGEVDLENEHDPRLERVSESTILYLQCQENERKKQEAELKKKAMLERGLQPNVDPIQDEFYTS